MEIAFIVVVKDPEIAKQKYKNVTVIGKDASSKGYIITLRASDSTLNKDPNVICKEVSQPLRITDNMKPD